MESFLFQAAIYLAAAALCVPLAVRFGLGSVLGYLVAGVLIGPITGLVGSETESLQHFAEFGVVMMLFLIGLELEPKALWDMRRRLLGLGFGQVVLTVGVVMAAAMFFGFAWQPALGIGMIFALSSTAIVMQTLEEKDLTSTRGGRSAFSVLLAQDIVVIPMLAIMPLLAVGSMTGNAGSGGDGHGGEAAPMGDGESARMVAEVTTWVSSLPGWGAALATVGAVAIVILGGHYLTRPMFRFAGHARLREMHTVVSLLFVIGVAVLMSLVGLSPALGTFLAGVVLANSEFRHELEADIQPFKGLLLGLFFITVGAGIDFGTLAGAPFVVLAIVVSLMVAKGVILYLLAVFARLKGRDRVLFTLSLAQAGEFGFVLSSVALQDGVIAQEVSDILLLSIALSMLLTPLLFIAYERISAHKSVDDAEQDDDIDEQAEVIIAGVGRFGQVVHRMLQGAGLRSVVLDRDMDTIQLLRKFGIKTYLGDPTRPELLEAAGISKAKVIVVALDNKTDAIRLVRMAKEANPDIHVVARAYDRVHVYELYRAGADQIVREMFDSSLRAGRYVLEQMGWSETDAYEARDAFFRHDRQAMLELAKLWEPGVPITDNSAYAEKAREFSKGLENALLTRFGEDAEAAEAAKQANRSDDDKSEAS
ncbi:cation:proton antiporter [Jannaschia pohangensis]|uniref:Kef-type potassium/proton antiporter, CPA2 family n=1 Tax=Jannaschia pohangensis TaxID=390807 RepID=A0A1I3LPP5_9RHOB|nr:cation:proton antiporter [Jannaschia pohangensis]SFI86446.1 Kef-type potassium/proton antiporter, CPA2 family [Jannaschia pohangensis]